MRRRSEDVHSCSDLTKSLVKLEHSDSRCVDNRWIVPSVVVDMISVL